MDEQERVGGVCVTETEVSEFVVAARIYFVIGSEYQRMLNTCTAVLRSVREVRKLNEFKSAISVRKPELSELVVSCNENFSILSNSHRVSFSTWHLGEEYGLFFFWLDFKWSESILLSGKACSPVEPLAPGEKFSVIHKYSRMVASTRQCNCVEVFILWDCVNQKWCTWFLKSWISNSELSFRILSNWENKPVSTDKGCVEVTAWNMSDDDIERQGLGLFVELSLLLLLIVLLLLLSVGQSELAETVRAPWEKLSVRWHLLLLLVVLVIFHLMNY